DSVIGLGSSWQAVYNFVAATDRDGEPVPFDQVQVSGTVDSDATGEYEVTYQYGGKKAKITVKVIESQESLQVKDSILYTGDQWKTQDNFVAATDLLGKNVAFEEVNVTGQVDTTQVGS